MSEHPYQDPVLLLDVARLFRDLSATSRNAGAARELEQAAAELTRRAERLQLPRPRRIGRLIGAVLRLARAA